MWPRCEKCRVEVEKIEDELCPLCSGKKELAQLQNDNEGNLDL